jgi:thioredoxin reductase
VARYDVIIAGGGPAGLSAALMLGRCRRRVLLCDRGEPRNARSAALHGYLTRDGIPPAEFQAAARQELVPYGIECRAVAVRSAQLVRGGFSVTLADGRRERARFLLLATGVRDHLPQVPGVAECYGRSVFHCPYCDGWELRDTPIAVYGKGDKGCGLSLELTGWSRDLVLVTDGPSELENEQQERLRAHGIRIEERRVSRLVGKDGQLEQIVFVAGPPLPRRALFFTLGQSQHSELTRRLGCQFNDKGTVRTGPYETTHVPGLYVAGDASRAVQWAIVAAAEGAEAAYAINQALLKEDLAAEQARVTSSRA